ncbi:calcium-regulated heat stable protein 1-like isoform X1, partial [Lates japonicus]
MRGLFSFARLREVAAVACSQIVVAMVMRVLRMPLAGVLQPPLTDPTPPPSSPHFDSTSSVMSSQARHIQGSRPVTPPLTSAGSPRSPVSP